jgi:hypothetical protein
MRTPPGPTTGLCLEIHDLAISKYVAGREKDLEFTRELARRRMTDVPTLLARLEKTQLAPTLRTVIRAASRRMPASSRADQIGAALFRARAAASPARSLNRPHCSIRPLNSSRCCGARGYPDSSDGPLQGECRRFDPVSTHQIQRPTRDTRYAVTTFCALFLPATRGSSSWGAGICDLSL